ncbi:MAG: sugar ABC transporter substrate-binding protein [Leptolyngbyaceae cyanobacterium SM2_3_12]|nr:sugar ABC transporter substrate-binding protein [Leptolyngbyaceae cyanobacterium SM2_3_12]
MPVQTPPAQPLTIQAEEPYTLGPGDRLSVLLFRVPQYSSEEVEVQVDGSLVLPLVGAITVQDLTLEQATATISQRYSEFLRRPVVSLNLISRRPLVIGLAGEVNRPGAYSLRIEGTSFPNLTQLFEAAGGITQSADLRQVQIRRQQDGGSQLITANLWELLNTGDRGQDIALRDGDSVYVPSTLVSLEEAPILAAATFSPDSSIPINVTVIGEVFRPGPYTLRGGTIRTGDAGVPGGESGSSNNNIKYNPVKVTDALQIAGGIKPNANIQQVQIRRLTRSGTEEVFSVNLWQLLELGESRQNAILQEGDTVFIPTATEAISPAVASQVAAASFSPNTIRINVVGEVRRSGLVEVPPNTNLNQAILAAGGFNTRAREDVVGLIRLNPDGSVMQREIPVDFTQGVSEENNPSLQNNDIIIVGETGVAQFSDTLGSVASPIADFLFILGAPFRFLNLFD